MIFPWYPHGPMAPWLPPWPWSADLELDGHLLEGALRQQVPLDATQRLVGVVVGLLHQTQLLQDGAPVR